MPTQNRRNLYFTDPQLAWLDAEAKRLGITFNELVRRIVDERRGARAGEADSKEERA